MSLQWTPRTRTARAKHKITVSVVLDDVTHQEALWKAEQIRRRVERIRPRSQYVYGKGYVRADKPVGTIESVETV